MTSPTRSTPATPSTRRIRELQASLPFFDWYLNSTYLPRQGDSEICDFMVGNPQEMPLPGYVEALRAHLEPENKDWFAYKLSEPETTEVVAASLRARTGLPYQADDVAMTNGALAAIAITLGTLVEPGDEVVILRPAYFFYDFYATGAGAVPVHVPLAAPDFRLDAAAVEAAITEQTAAVLLNSPNNPTGRVFEPAELDELAAALHRASERLGRRIHLISDEAYNRIVYDGRRYPSPAEHYPDTLTIYTYGKTLLTPGQRLGYVALAPTMAEDERVRLRRDIVTSQVALGWGFPNALLQHALAEIERVSIDIVALERRRDRLVGGLRSAGYETTCPEGTFYVLVRSPDPDDAAFCAGLADQDVFCLPGSIIDVPGWFRISLTASDEMVERALPRFVAALGQ
jgi:aspartate aminotransferase